MDEILALIAEPRRQRILRLIWDCELSAGQIAESFDVTFGAVSQHLRVLRDAGLVTLRKESRRRFYRAQKEALGPLAAMLEAIWADRLGELKRLAEHEEDVTGRPN